MNWSLRHLISVGFVVVFSLSHRGHAQHDVRLSDVIMPEAVGSFDSEPLDRWQTNVRWTQIDARWRRDIESMREWRSINLKGLLIPDGQGVWLTAPKAWWGRKLIDQDGKNLLSPSDEDKLVNHESAQRLMSDLKSFGYRPIELPIEVSVGFSRLEKLPEKIQEVELIFPGDCCRLD